MGLTSDVIGLEVLLNARATGMAAFSEAEAWTTKLGKAAGFAAIGLGIGLVGGLAASVKAAGDYQESTLSLVHGAGELMTNLAMVRQGMLDMAGQVGIGAEQLSSAMYLIESAGFHGADGLTVLKAAAEGSKIGMADMTVVGNALTSVLNAYNLPASQAAKVTSQMIAAVEQGKMHMEDLASSLSAVLPVAAAAGINFAQVGGAIATMTAQGMSSQQTTQDLADTIRHLQNPTQQQQQEWEQLGLSTNDVTSKLGSRGLTGTLDLLTTTITSHMGPAGAVLLNTFKQSQTASADMDKMISAMPAHMQALAHSYEAGTVSQAQWRTDMKALPADQAALMQQFTVLANKTDGFNAMLRAGSPSAQTYSAALAKMMGDSTGLNTTLMLTGGHMGTFKDNVASVTAAVPDAAGNVKNWNIVQQNFNQQMDRAKAAIGSMAIEVGTSLLPALTSAALFFMDKVIPGIQGATSWFQKHGDQIKIVAGIIGAVLLPTLVNFTVVAGVLAVAAIAKATVAFALQTSQMIANNIQIWAKLAAVTALAIGQGAVAVATGIWTAAQWLLNVALDANPIGLIVIAIALLVAGAILAYQHIGWFRDAVNFLWKELQIAWTWLAQETPKALTAIGSFFSWLGTQAHDLVGAIGGFFSWLGTAAHNAVTAAGSAFSALGTGVHNALLAVVTWFIWLNVEIAIKLMQLWAGIQALFKEGVDLVIGLVQGFVEGIVGFFSWLYNHNYYFKDLVDFIAASWKTIKDDAIAAWNFISSGIVWIVQGLGEKIISIVQSYVNFLVWVWNGISGAAMAAWNAISSTAVAAWTAISSWLESKWTAISDKAVAVWTAVSNWFENAWRWISSKAEAAWDAIASWLGIKWQEMSTKATSIWDAVSSWFTGKWKDISSGISSAWNAIGLWLETKWGAISNKASDAWGQLTAGITQKANDAWNAVTGAFGGAEAWFADITTKAWNWGANLISSIGKGIADKAGVIRDAVKAVGGVIADWLGFHSPTKLGPGADADKWMPNLVKMMAAGLVEGAPTISAASGNLATTLAPSPALMGGRGGGSNINVSIDLRNAVISNDASMRQLAQAVSTQIYKQVQLAGAGWH